MKRSQDSATDYARFLSQADLVARCAGRIVLLHQRRVLGSGDDYPAALADAQRQAEVEKRSLPPHDEVLVMSVVAPVGFDPEFFGNTPARRPEERGV